MSDDRGALKAVDGRDSARRTSTTVNRSDVENDARRSEMSRHGVHCERNSQFSRFRQVAAVSADDRKTEVESTTTLTCLQFGLRTESDAIELAEIY